MLLWKISTAQDLNSSIQCRHKSSIRFTIQHKMLAISIRCRFINVDVDWYHSGPSWISNRKRENNCVRACYVAGIPRQAWLESGIYRTHEGVSQGEGQGLECTADRANESKLGR